MTTTGKQKKEQGSQINTYSLMKNQNKRRSNFVNEEEKKKKRQRIMKSYY